MKRCHYSYHNSWEGGDEIGGTILVVDPDGETYLEPLNDRLNHCCLVHVPWAQQACQFFLSKPVDLVLLAHTPKKPCFELLSLFKSSRPSVPVLVLASQGSEQLAVELFRMGARDYFSKPVRVDELALAVSGLLGIQQKEAELPVWQEPNGIESALNYIHGHYKSHLSLAQVAEKAGMSVSSFSRCFKKKTDMTFVDYVNTLRVSNASKLLKEGQLSLLDVAVSCGFTNQSHFNRIFKKYSRVTPGQYRRALEGR